MFVIDRGWVPDSLLRLAIRRICQMRLQEQAGKSKPEFLKSMDTSPIALATATANEQHYEVPPKFYELVLGPNLKYSSGYWANDESDLAAAEISMLDLTMTRAELSDGQRILELGCGWGSLTLAMARRFPNAKITAVSNSHAQRRHIWGRLMRDGLENVEVLTCDMNDFQIDAHFDRIVSVEMFEHMRNYRELLTRLNGWLASDGLAFIHIFCHREYAYPYEIRDATDWLAKYFFTGGMMPSADIFSHFPQLISVEKHWQVDGRHYGRTAEAWLKNIDMNRTEVIDLFESTYGSRVEARRWFNYWRIFFLACAELFAYNDGKEWFVGHYLLRPHVNAHRLEQAA